jgi:hypothetical protein
VEHQTVFSGHSHGQGQGHGHEQGQGYKHGHGHRHEHGHEHGHGQGYGHLTQLNRHIYLLLFLKPANTFCPAIRFVVDMFCCRYVLSPICFVTNTFWADLFCPDTFCPNMFCPCTCIYPKEYETL